MLQHLSIMTTFIIAYPLVAYCFSIFTVHWVTGCCESLTSSLTCACGFCDAYWYLQLWFPTRKILGSESNLLMAQFCTLKIQWAVLKLVVNEYCMINLFYSSQNPRRMNENMNQRLELQNDSCMHDESNPEICTNRQQALSAIFCWCLLSYALWLADMLNTLTVILLNRTCSWINKSMQIR